MIRLSGHLGSRWATVALAGSLVLNAFLIGVIVTDSLRDHHRGDRPRVVNFELRRLASKLPQDALDRVAADLAPLAPDFDARFDKLRAIRDDINRMAAAPTPDRAAIDAQLEAMRTAGDKLQEDVQRATYDAILKLPPDDRAGLAKKSTGG